MFYQYACTVVRVVDGDTLHLDVDLGLDIRTKMTVRLSGINAPETSTPEGKAAKAHAEQWVQQHGPKFVLWTIKDKREKYGRYLAVVSPYGPTPVSLNQQMLMDGHAVPYMSAPVTSPDVPVIPQPPG